MATPQTGSLDRITVTVDKDLEDLAPVFLRNRRKDLQTIRTALSEQDFETVKILGHRMRGDGAGYGFEAISLIGTVMESAATRRDRSVLEQQTQQLEDFLARVHVEYR
jgi:HPt (histidine-containing phosphotransfer) domain-containing protein